MTSASLSHPRVLFVPGPPRRGLLLGFFGTLTLGLALLVGLSVGIALSHDGLVMPGVRVAGVEIGGLNRAAAESRLRAELPSLTAGSATLVVDGTSVTIPYEDIGRGYELGAMLDAAYGVGRSGSSLTDGLDRLRSGLRGSSLPVAVHPFDPDALDRIAADISARFSSPAVNPTVSFDPAAGFVASEAAPGRLLDANAVRTALGEAVATPEPGDLTIAMATTAVQPTWTTEQAWAAANDATLMTRDALSLIGGGVELTLEPATLVGLVEFGPFVGDPYAARIAPSALRAALTPLTAQVASEPQDATFTWDAAGVAGVVPAVDGRELDIEMSVDTVTATLHARATGAAAPSAVLAVVGTPAALTTADATAAAASMRQLGSWTTYYDVGEGNFWGANISIPAQDIDGLVVAPGEWFDWWEDIGPVTLDRGYGYGGAIIGGRSVVNGALAGGMCSTSTTIFNAAMRAGLEIGERENHSYYIERYPLGLDATVLRTDTSATSVTFRNDMADPIVIRSYTGYGYVRFDIWGVPDGRTVTLSAPVITNQRAAIETTVRNNSLAPGTAIRREYMHDGFDSVVTRWVRDANGEIIWENVWASDYRTVNGITEVGPPKPKPPKPPEED